MESKVVQYRGRKIPINEIYSLHNELEQLEMPTGFIYTQIYVNEQPEKFWPNNIWQDVSEQCAGLFFRVIGGNSRALDRTQDQSYPGLIIESSVNLKTKVQSKINITITSGQWSDYVRTGGTYPNKKRIGLSFHISSDDVRPKNTPIRIWKCLGDSKERRLWSRERINLQMFSTSMSMRNLTMTNYHPFQYHHGTYNCTTNQIPTNCGT